MKTNKGIHVTCFTCGGSVYLEEGLNCKKCKHPVSKAQQNLANGVLFKK